MKIGFDIGGVISKYPEIIKLFLHKYNYDEYGYDSNKHDIFIITDQHPKKEVLRALCKNGFINGLGNIDGSTTYLTNIINPENVYCADYEKYGNMAKAVLIKELNLDIFIDDFDGYLQWDSSFGPQPLLLKVMPDAFKPYWADSWKQDESEFGRRKYNELNNRQKQ